MNTSIIKVDNLSKSYGKHQIFNHLSLSFKENTSYALVGPSGSGKTSLLNILAHLDDDYEGEVFVKNNLLRKIKSLDYFRYHMGYLFQNYGLLENDTVKNNLELALIGQKMGKKSKQEKYENVLKDVNLSYIDLDTPIFRLSGGEAQRIALAKLILKEPAIILADEPTASLDRRNEKLVLDILLKLKSKGRTIILATHSQNVWSQVDVIKEIPKL